jgi:hypothetical protein
LLDRRHPPSFGHEQLPPRKSGSWLFKRKYARKIFLITDIEAVN